LIKIVFARLIVAIPTCQPELLFPFFLFLPFLFKDDDLELLERWNAGTLERRINKKEKEAS
jgi:hypothetical protein